jgi:hypothetical protein
MPTPSVGSGVGATVKWKGSRNRSQPRHSGEGRNPGSFAEPSSMKCHHQPHMRAHFIWTPAFAGVTVADRAGASSFVIPAPGSGRWPARA